MRRRTSTFLLVVAVLILLPAIAFASPPDPSWIAGIYDGTDGDDIVNLVDQTAGTEAVSPTPIFQVYCWQVVLLLTSGPDPSPGFLGGEFNRGPPSSPVLSLYGVPSPLLFLVRFRGNYPPHGDLIHPVAHGQKQPCAVWSRLDRQCDPARSLHRA